MIKKTEYFIVPDSSILYSPKPEKLVCPSFKENWSRCADVAIIQLRVPSVVLGELAQQKFRIAAEAVGNAKKNLLNLCATTGIKMPSFPGEKEMRQRIENRYANWVEEEGGQTIATPYASISWEAVENDAIWRHPPFEKNDTEKGFRDRLVLEAVAFFCTQNSDSNVAFVCSDRHLQTATRDRLSDAARFKLYESMESLSSELELLDLKLTPEFVRTILDEVGDKFFTSDSEECLFSRGDVKQKIVNQFHVPLTLRLSEELYAKAERANPIEDNVEVRETVFLKKEGAKTYLWKTKIQLIRQSDPHEALGISAIFGLRRTSEFEVFWKCDISPVGEFTNLELVKIEHVETKLRNPWSPDPDDLYYKRMKEQHEMIRGALETYSNASPAILPL